MGSTRSEILKKKHAEAHEKKRIFILEHTYDCYAEYGLRNIGIPVLADACGMSEANFYRYFDSLEEVVIQATEHCMSKVEDEFMAKAPTKLEEVEKFIDEIPYWTAKEHGKKYRLMYQVYSNPKYIEHGKKFFEGVNKRYSEYSEGLAEKIGLPTDVLRPMIFVFVRACVHYALFEDEFYLKEQLRFLKQSMKLFYEKYNTKA